MLNFRTSRWSLAAAAALIAVPALAQQDMRQVMASEACKVEVLVGKEIPPLGTLRITDDTKRVVGTLESVGDSANLAGKKSYDFTFIRKGGFTLQGYDFWLLFSTWNCAYRCHIVSKRTGDKITVTDGRWDSNQGAAIIQTTPGKPLLIISFPK